MHIIIVGCGRVGSTLALRLQNQHDIVVVDRNAESFRRLGEAFTGRTVVGVGFDREVLESAGISAQSAVVAVTSGDNSNILVARVARENFGAQPVVARIYDPQRAALYERLGINTVASVRWTVDRINAGLFPDRDIPAWTDPTGGVTLREVRITAKEAGRKISELGSGVTACSLARTGRSWVPAHDTIVQEGDVLFVAAAPDAVLHFGEASH